RTVRSLPSLPVTTPPETHPGPIERSSTTGTKTAAASSQLRMAAAIWEENMRSYVMAALCAAGLTLAATSGAVAAPIAPVGNANANDARVTAHYYYHRHYHRHHHHHRHCWWRHGHRHCG